MKFLNKIMLTAALLTLLACSPQAETGNGDTTPDKQTNQPSASLPEGCLGEKPAEPVMCTADWRPVCGCDGKTYSNVCNAKANGVLKWEEGECSGGEAKLK